MDSRQTLSYHCQASSPLSNNYTFLPIKSNSNPLRAVSLKCLTSKGTSLTQNSFEYDYFPKTKFPNNINFPTSKVLFSLTEIWL